ncbi:MAG: hypothetical protein LBH25_10365 [Fibromonadaceae bacterium]|nr:hypothetical protein [Fibromonadaceae bacterium]
MRFIFTTSSEAIEQPQADKCLLYLFFVFILFCIVACTETGGEEKLPAYANKSEETVKIVAIVRGFTQDGTYITYGNYEKFIAAGDTLHISFYYKENSEEWIVPSPDCGIAVSNYDACDNPVRMELYFLNEPQKCLIFDGPIKNDGIDIRSWDSYKKGNEIPDWADFWAGVEYVYTITPQHREMAREEDCQSSAEAAWSASLFSVRCLED